MGQTARREHLESKQSCSGPARPHGPIRVALKLFWSPQASQAIEKLDSARENPRKSKSKKPSSKVHFGAGARPGGDIQTSNLLWNEATANFSAPPHATL
jgi:hypothetical protein